MKHREIEYKGVKLALVSKTQFGHIIGRSRITVENWIKVGFLPPPAFEDAGTVRNSFGRGLAPVKLYLKHEAYFIRQLIQAHGIGRGVEISAACRQEAHQGMRKIRKQVLEGHPDLMTYPIILEFFNYEDCKSYFANLGAPPGVAEQVYRLGDRIHKIRRENGSEETQKDT